MAAAGFAPLIISLIAGAAMGERKRQQDQQNFKENQKLEATKEKWASFTGQRGKRLNQPDGAGTLMQSLVSSALMGMQFMGKDGATGGGAPGSFPGTGGEATPSENATPNMGTAGNQEVGTGMGYGQYHQDNYSAPYRGR